MKRRLPKKNAIYTPASGTTVTINYCEKEQKLEVEFIGGNVYHYMDVPAEIWNTYKDVIESGKSSGEFVNFEIKPFYEYEKII